MILVCLFRCVQPSIRLSVHPSFHSSVGLSVLPSLRPPVRPSVCNPFVKSREMERLLCRNYYDACLPFYMRPSVHPSVRLSVRLSVCLYIRLSVCLSVRAFVRPSVCNSFVKSMEMERLLCRIYYDATHNRCFRRPRTSVSVSRSVDRSVGWLVG